MRKHFSLTALMAVVSLVCGFVFTSCSMQKNEMPEPEVIEKTVTKYLDKEVEKIIDNVLVAKTEETNVEILYNGQSALKASVTPDSLCMTLPVAEHTASTIDGSNNAWRDSHGMGFTGMINQTQLEGLSLNVHIEANDPFSTTKSIHPKVTWLKGRFNLVGMATDNQTGKSNTFSIPVPTGSYFMCDSTVDVRQITETKLEIVHDTTYIRNDSIITEKVYEYVDVVKDAAVYSGFGYGTIDFSYGDKSFSFRMELDSTLIHRDENGWGVAVKTAEDRKGFDLNDKQTAKYTIRENGIRLESVNFVGESASFMKINDIFKYGTATVNVTVSYTDKNGQAQTREFTVGGSYLHEKVIAKAEPEVVTPEITTEHTYTVDSTRTAVKDSEGNLIGEKVRLTIKRDDEKTWKVQYMAWETGLLCPTITGTQVGGNSMLRATTATPEAYTAEGWSGTDTSREGFTVIATSKQYKFRTAFAAVPGFGASEESVAECNIVFGTRTCTFTDPENSSFTFTISADGVSSNETSVKITFDQVGTDEAAKAEVNGRGLEYEYIGTHYLTVEQYVGGKLVNTQSRNEQLLYPKN